MKKIIMILVILFSVAFVPSCTFPMNNGQEELYTITLLNEDGTVYKELEVKASLEVTIENLEKEGYTFLGWYENDVLVSSPYIFTKDTTLMAKFEENLSTHTYKFIVDGEVIHEGVGNHGSTITYPSNPVKQGDAQYSYTFIGWDNEALTLTEDVVFNALFDKVVNKYSYKFVVDGKVVAEGTEEYGFEIPYPSDPTKAPTKEYTYTFKGWSKEDTILTKNISFTALFNKVKNKYTCTFIDEDGTVLQQEELEYGTMPSEPEHPSKEGFKFAGWDKTISKIVDDVTYKAVYKEITNVDSLEGKVISILGDSISTFYKEGSEMNSYYSGTNQFYYPLYSSTIKTVDLTWWYKLIKNNDMKLGINNSWSGSCAYGTNSSAGVSDGRINTIDDNGEPDIVIIYLGTNDCASGYSTEQFGNAIREMVAKVNKITTADIFITTLGYSAYKGSSYKEETRVSYNEELRKIAAELNCGIVPLDDYIVRSSYSFYLGDNLHYNAKGAELLSKIYEKSIKEYYGIAYDEEIEVEHKEVLPEGVIGKITATSSGDFWTYYQTEVFLATSSSYTSPLYSYRIEIAKNNDQYYVKAIHKSGESAKYDSDYVIVISDSHESNKALLADLEKVTVGSIVEFDPNAPLPTEIIFKEGNVVDDGNNNPPQGDDELPIEKDGKLLLGVYNDGIWTKYDSNVLVYSYDKVNKGSTYEFFFIIGISKVEDEYKVTYLKKDGVACDYTECDYYIFIFQDLSVKSYYDLASLDQIVVLSDDITSGKCYIEFK